MNSQIVPLILSGGVGMRLWPISRASNPKQLMDLGDGTNMLQRTLTRLKKIKNLTKPIILCNNKHKSKMARRLKQINIESSLIVVEPVSRGTAPALIAALLRLDEIGNRDRICLVMPSDHHVSNIANFDKTISKGLEYAKDGYIVIFGVIPTYPESGYGYIKKGPSISTTVQGDHLAFYVKKFVEKPNIETAKLYLNSNEYFWNSGIFMFQSSCILKEFYRFTPSTVKFCKLAVTRGIKKSNFFHLEKKFFAQCSKKSIDYAIMEKTSKAVVIPMDVNWKDLGSWESLLKAGEKDTDGNILKGDVIAYDTKNSYVYAESRLVTAIGMNEHIIVETADSVLVVPSFKTQDVKKVVAKSKLHERRKIYPRKIKHHSWGIYERLFTSETITISLIVITPGSFVDIKQNFESGTNWIVTNGQGVISNGKSKLYLDKKDSLNIECISGYLLYNLNQYKISLKIIELKKSNLFDIRSVDQKIIM